jgi:hypothetical protein
MNLRPEGFDYTQPDPEDVRCPQCNSNGMNRSGLIPTSYYGSTSTVMYGIPCICKNGLRITGEET